MQEIRNMINSLKTIIEDSNEICIPAFGNKSKINLKSSNYTFTVDLNRSGHKKPKCTFQLRENKNQDKALVRLDLVGRDHPNPEGNFPYAGETIPCPHIHMADKDHGIAVAYPLNEDTAQMYLDEEMIENLGYVLKEFLRRINVANVDNYEYNYPIEIEC